MIQCETTCEVAGSPDAVFAFVDEAANAPRWLGRCVRIEPLSPPPKGVGSRLRYIYRDRGRTGSMDGEVTAYQPGRQLAMRYGDRMVEVAVSFRFAPAPGGTRIDHAIEITPRSLLARVMQPMIRTWTARQLERDTAALRAVLAGGPT